MLSSGDPREVVATRTLSAATYRKMVGHSASQPHGLSQDLVTDGWTQLAFGHHLDAVAE